MALIEIKHLYKKFVQKNDEVVALDDINLSIEKADIYGIIGMSGAGKSTLLKGILGLMPTYKGEIIFGDGLKPNDLNVITKFASSFPVLYIEKKIYI